MRARTTGCTAGGASAMRIMRLSAAIAASASASLAACTMASGSPAAILAPIPRTALKPTAGRVPVTGVLENRTVKLP